MKIRNGFVSNSSSSSFICEVSGHIESGWDLCLEDADMYECENNHTFLRKYVVGNLPDDCDEYYIPKENCPICNLTTISNDDLVSYLIKEIGKTKKEICNDIKTKFTSYKQLKEYIK